MSEPQVTPPILTIEPPAPLSPADRAAMLKARRGRNLAIAFGLVVFIAVVYAVTLIRMGANVAAPHF